jgi:hypothetical protein
MKIKTETKLKIITIILLFFGLLLGAYLDAQILTKINI